MRTEKDRRNESPFAKATSLLPPFFRRHRLIAAVPRIFRSLKIVTFRFNGTALITADISDPAARQALITRTFEPEFFAMAEAFLVKGTAFLDIGANHGFCTFGLIARDVYEGISYHVFEANTHLCETLKQSLELYPGKTIFINNNCVSDRDGKSTLHIEEGHWGGSYISNNDSDQIVTNVVLDDYIHDKHISRVSFLKMDIEGHEIHALRGLEKSIRGGLIGAMYIECSGPNLERQGSSAAELIGILRQLDCALYWCKDDDFNIGLAPRFKTVSPNGLGSVRLAPIQDFPSAHQTDLLAIPAAGMFNGYFTHDR